jgi:hypothetical protein
LNLLADVRAKLNGIVDSNHNREGGTRHLIISSTSEQLECKSCADIRIGFASSADSSIYAINARTILDAVGFTKFKP